MNAMAVGALIGDTLRESFARKIFWGFWGCSTALMLLLLTVLNIDVVEGSIAAVKIFGNDVAPGQGGGLDAAQILELAFGALAAFLFSVGLFLAIFAASGLIPTVFEPGRIGLLLSKPLSRGTLLLGRFLGAVVVIGMNFAYLTGGVWLILGWKTRLWKPELLYSGVLALFAFAVILTLVLLVAVWSNSSVLSTMAAYLVLLISAIVSQHETLERVLDTEWSRQTVKALYYALPKAFEIGDLARRLMAGGQVESWTPFWSSALFGAAMLTGAWALFERKDY